MIPGALLTKRAIARLSALAALLAALLGAALGLYLTELAARGRPPTCLTALTTHPHLLLGLPLGLWTAASSLTVAVLAAAHRRRPGRPDSLTPHLLLLFALIGVAAAALLAVRAPCGLPLALAGVSALLALAGALLLLTTPPPPRRRRLRAVASVRAIFWASALWLTATGALSLAYQQRRAAVDPSARLTHPQLAALPAAAVLFGAPDPEVVAAYFLDPSCPRSRAAFQALTSLLRHDDDPARVQLRIYQLPREAGGCAPGDLPIRFGASSPVATASHACQAAFAIECVEQLQPGLGLAMVGATLDLQDAEQPYFTPRRLAHAALAVGLRLDPSDPQDPFFRCMSGDPDVHRRVREHLHFAARYGPAEAPHGYLIGVAGDRLDLTRVEPFRGPLGEPELRSGLARVARRARASPRPAQNPPKAAATARSRADAQGP
jgi:hypothetical protein